MSARKPSSEKRPADAAAAKLSPPPSKLRLQYDADPDLSSDLKAITSALHYFREKAGKDGHHEKETTISSEMMRSMFCDLMMEIVKNSEIWSMFGDRMMKIKECNSESAKMQDIWEKAAQVQTLQETTMSIFEEDNKTLMTGYVVSCAGGGDGPGAYVYRSEDQCWICDEWAKLTGQKRRREAALDAANARSPETLKVARSMNTSTVAVWVVGGMRIDSPYIVSLDSKIGDLKSRICADSQIPTDLQVLSNGDEMLPDSRAVRDIESADDTPRRLTLTVDYGPEPFSVIARHTATSDRNPTLRVGDLTPLTGVGQFKENIIDLWALTNPEMRVHVKKVNLLAPNTLGDYLICQDMILNVELPPAINQLQAI